VSRIAILNSVQKGILALRREAAPRQGRGRQARTIAAVIEELEALNRASERDFLEVGEKLLAFRTAAAQIGSEIAAVVELFSGQQGRSASETLHRLLERSGQIDARIGESGQALSEIREHASRLRKAFAGLTNMVAVFRSLCTLTQIETARLGGVGADLGHLAAEIRPLSESIQTAGEGVLEACGRLDQAVRGALENGSTLRSTALKEMPLLIADVTGSLRALAAQREKALESSRLQAAEYAAVRAAIDELVSSIQFHDITRQQVEHVVKALRRLRAGWMGPNRSPAGPDTRTVLTLQSSQLAEAARLFAQSIERIGGAVESIAARLRGSAEAVRTLVGVSGGHQPSFLEQMETHFTAIQKVLGDCTRVQAEMQSAIAGLGDTAGKMRESVTGIRGTEIQIQRISTNATIRAIHIGASGVALNKIAEVMQRLALESNTHTEEAAAALEGMTDTIRGISGPGEASEAPEMDISGEMQGAVAQLHAAGQESATRADRIAQLSARLAEDIEMLRAGISAGRMFAETAARARSEMDSIAHQPGREAEIGVHTRQHLAEFAKTYTMQRQRDVHESVVGTAGPPQAAAPAPIQSPPRDGDLGDNVELF
jgi:hypothetical protein